MDFKSIIFDKKYLFYAATRPQPLKILKIKWDLKSYLKNVIKVSYSLTLKQYLEKCELNI